MPIPREEKELNSSFTSSKKLRVFLSQFFVIIALLLQIIEYLVNNFKAFLPLEKVFSSELFPFFSILLLLGSALLWLQSTDERLEKIDEIESHLNRLGQLEKMSQYGHSSVLVANLHESTYAHVQAGYETISPILWKGIPQLAEEFHELKRGKDSPIVLKEYHVVDTFVFNLIKALPTGSVWMGISRLQSADAWREKTAHYEFHEFDITVKNRIQKREITVFRLYVFEDEQHIEEMMSIMQGQHEARLKVKYIIAKGNSANDNSLDDISLIWTPKSLLSKSEEINQPDDLFDRIVKQSNKSILSSN